VKGVCAVEANVTQGMSMEDKRRLYDSLALEFSIESKTTPYTRLEQDTWETICLVCPEADVAGMRSRVNAYGRKRYAERCQEVEDFISMACPPAMRLVQRRAVRLVVLRCLKDWMRDAGIVVAVPSLLNSMSYMPGAVDEAFPGYAAAKLLDRVAMAYAH
jgi:hypothetical protein